MRAVRGGRGVLLPVLGGGPPAGGSLRSISKGAPKSVKFWLFRFRELHGEISVVVEPAVAEAECAAANTPPEAPPSAAPPSPSRTAARSDVVNLTLSRVEGHNAVLRETS